MALRLTVLVVLIGLATTALMEVLLVTEVIGGSDRPETPAITTLPTESRTPLGDPVAGAAVFARADCGSCHTFAPAGSTGTLGPNLDVHYRNHTHSVAEVVTLVRRGSYLMPPYAGRLRRKEIRDVATFVVFPPGADERR